MCFYILKKNSIFASNRTVTMNNIINKLRIGGIPALLVATTMVILILAVQYYISVRNDDEDARKLVNRELIIVEQQIMSEFKNAEFALEDMADRAHLSLADADKMLDITHYIIKENPNIKGAAIAFVPYFYPKKGHWFEPRCIREDNEIISEEIGGIHHDYTKLNWYREGIKNKKKNGHWSNPYIDDTQNGIYILSLTRPLHQGKKVVGVLCIDMELAQLEKILKEAEPYPGSICQLINDKGEVLISSGETKSRDTNYFSDSKKLKYSDVVVQLSCPKKAIYGQSTVLNLVTLGLLLLGMLLLAYIVRRTIYTITSLNAAQQQKKIMDREMRIAHGIQMDIVRRDFPEELHATLLPMKEVGGDLYDFYQENDTLYFIIGDVSGKGIPAAMMMSATVNLFRMAARHFSTPAEIMGEINDVLSERNPSLLFVTAFVGKIDMKHELMTYCNAGHNPPILNNSFMEMDPDIPLGYQTNFPYRQYGAFFPEGSRLVLYTDGITEARNSAHQLMGEDYLLNIVQAHYTEPLSTMTDSIIDDTNKFAGKTIQMDDITLMCITNKTAKQHPTIVITNDIEELQRVKLIVREYCDCLGCEPHLTRKIMLAVEEAVANIINYAYPKESLGRIEIELHGRSASCKGQKGDLTVTITDFGEPFDPTARQEVDVTKNIEKRQIGGLGIYLYLKLMDSCIYQRTEDGRNVLIMTKGISK